MKNSLFALTLLTTPAIAADNMVTTQVSVPENNAPILLASPRAGRLQLQIVGGSIGCVYGEYGTVTAATGFPFTPDFYYAQTTTFNGYTGGLYAVCPPGCNAAKTVPLQVRELY